MKPGRIPDFLAAAAIATLFLAFAGPGVRAGITGDDLMNTYKAWRAPWSDHLRDAVLFWRFSDSFRPVGSLFYRAIFDLWGLNPLPFRIACFALMLANLWLAWEVLRRVAGARLAAALAVLLLAYHGQFWGLYTNTGFCYDLLCFFFWNAAFAFYLKPRERGLPLGWARVAAWSGLYVLAMDAKEMAVSLPVVILAYELLANPPDWRRPLAWLWGPGRVPAVGAVLTVMFLAGRVAAPEGLQAMAAYRPEANPLVYLKSARRLLELALYSPGWLTPPLGYAAMALMAAAAVLWRSLPFRRGVIWVLVGILPIALIPNRGVDAAYVAAPGFALALAAAIAAAAESLRLRPAVAFAGVLAALLFVHGRYGRIDFEARTAAGRRTAALHRQMEAMPRGRSVLFLHDPYPEQTWDSAFLYYLTTRDPEAFVRRLDWLVEQPGDDRFDFDVVLTADGDRLMACDAGPFHAVRKSELAPRAAAARCGPSGE